MSLIVGWLACSKPEEPVRHHRGPQNVCMFTFQHTTADRPCIGNVLQEVRMLLDSGDPKSYTIMSAYIFPGYQACLTLVISPDSDDQSIVVHIERVVLC